MKIFKNLFLKNNNVEIGSPAAGRLISIKEVHDPAFNEEVLGKGVAVVPSNMQICAPVDGKVSSIFPTGHAVAVTSRDGVEILIHVGLDTVKLKGRHFTIHAQEGQEVKKGELLIEADIEKIQAEGYDITTPIVICNSNDFSKIHIVEPGIVSQGEEILKVEK